MSQEYIPIESPTERVQITSQDDLNAFNQGLKRAPTKPPVNPNAGELNQYNQPDLAGLKVQLELMQSKRAHWENVVANHQAELVDIAQRKANAEQLVAIIGEPKTRDQRFERDELTEKLASWRQDKAQTEKVLQGAKNGLADAEKRLKAFDHVGMRRLQHEADLRASLKR